jgi:hypothetical protein
VQIFGDFKFAKNSSYSREPESCVIFLILIFFKYYILILKKCPTIGSKNAHQNGGGGKPNLGFFFKNFYETKPFLNCLT